ncbi:MAG TPA: molybdopterin oxidoreductase family protein [Chloroflexota bacterium]|nr:molybdopterin oxidoreductase family protein [Chloroflexota bacterium]
MKHIEHDEIKRSICAFDCPDACGLIGYVKAGQLVGVGGDPDHPATRGHICAKVAFDHHRVHGPNRLREPLRRTGAKGSGQFEPISWGEAIETIAANFRRVKAEHGPEAILPYSYAGTMGIVNYNIGHRFFYKLGASQLRRSICSAAGNAGYMYSNGPNRGIDPEETVDSKYVIAWGANLVSANVHQMALVQEARRKGAKFVVIDVHRNKTGDAADWFIPIRPGTDGALALGLMHVIVAEDLHDKDWIVRHTSGFEQLRERLLQFPPERVADITGVPAEDVRQLAREFATTQPAFIRIGNGIQHHDNGGMCVRNIACLPALVGAWRHRGGGAMKSNRGYSAMNERALQRPDLMAKPARVINMNQLGLALTEIDDPPVMAMYVYNSNPAAVAPSQEKVIRGLERENLFLAVHDVVMTDTCRYADVVLPATTNWEHQDLYDSYWHLYAGVAEPAIDPVGQAKPNIEVFQLLAKAMGFADPCFAESTEDVIRAALNNPDNACLEGVTFERLRDEGPLRVGPRQKHQPFTELYSDEMAQHGHDPLPAWTPLPESGEGLWLITPPNHYFLNSSLAGVDELVAREGRPTLQISAADAHARGIADGDRVRAVNGRGAVDLHACITDAVQPGVVVSQGVWWPGNSPGGRGVNATTPDRVADMAGGAVFFSNKVEVKRLTPS